MNMNQLNKCKAIATTNIHTRINTHRFSVVSSSFRRRPLSSILSCNINNNNKNAVSLQWQSIDIRYFCAKNELHRNLPNTNTVVTVMEDSHTPVSIKHEAQEKQDNNNNDHRRGGGKLPKHFKNQTEMISNLIKICKKMQFLSNRFLIMLPVFGGCMSCLTVYALELTVYDVLLMSIIPCAHAFRMCNTYRAQFLNEGLNKFDLNKLQELLLLSTDHTSAVVDNDHNSAKDMDVDLLEFESEESQSEKEQATIFLNEQIVIAQELNLFLTNNYRKTVLPFIGCAAIVAVMTPFTSYILLIYPLSFYFFSPAFMTKSLRNHTRKFVD